MRKKAWAISVLCLISVLILPILVVKLIRYRNFMARSKIVGIDDVSQKTTVLLSKDSEQEHIDAIEILITGNIDRSATIHPHNGGGEYPTYHIKSGRIRLRIFGDWYSDKCLLEYEPVNVSLGNLKIRYRFLEFDEW